MALIAKAGKGGYGIDRQSRLQQQGTMNAH
jgi:hypothetical protein